MLMLCGNDVVVVMGRGHHTEEVIYDLFCAAARTLLSERFTLRQLDKVMLKSLYCI